MGNGGSDLIEAYDERKFSSGVTLLIMFGCGNPLLAPFLALTMILNTLHCLPTSPPPIP